MARTGDGADDLAQVVLAELGAGPEADVLEAGRELGVRLEPRRQAAAAELLQEALVGAPEQPADKG